MKVTICRNGRTFEAYVSSIGFHMAEINFYEVVRPSWKIFRTKFLPFHSATIAVLDYDSIMEAVEKKLSIGLRNEAKDKEVQDKWQEFINNSQNS